MLEKETDCISKENFNLAFVVHTYHEGNSFGDFEIFWGTFHFLSLTMADMNIIAALFHS